MFVKFAGSVEMQQKLQDPQVGLNLSRVTPTSEKGSNRQRGIPDLGVYCAN